MNRKREGGKSQQKLDAFFFKKPPRVEEETEAGEHSGAAGVIEAPETGQHCGAAEEIEEPIMITAAPREIHPLDIGLHVVINSIYYIGNEKSYILYRKCGSISHNPAT